MKPIKLSSGNINCLDKFTTRKMYTTQNISNKFIYYIASSTLFDVMSVCIGKHPVKTSFQKGKLAVL